LLGCIGKNAAGDELCNDGGEQNTKNEKRPTKLEPSSPVPGRLYNQIDKVGGAVRDVCQDSQHKETLQQIEGHGLSGLRQVKQEDGPYDT
jgi:hypothetical protein